MASAQIHFPAIEWGRGSPIRVLWAERLEKPVITAQTACECDDIAVLAIYSQVVRKPHSRRHKVATLSPDSDVPPELRFHIRSLYEKHKSAILDRHQTPDGLLQATTALFAEIWKSAHALNLDGIHGARQALRWCFDAYCVLQAPWSAVKLKVLSMGSNLTRGFGIVASVPLLSGEYIYELMGLMSSDGNAKHTRLSEIEAAGNTVRILCGPLRMVNHDCKPNAESEPVALSTQERKSPSIIQEITLMMRNNVRAALARALYEQAVALQ
ncbi:hypothetical protein B0H13DRAFT_1855872 [Mycena leptocephala]|nr:hypothetical protein B0H13DRAFT_1855872 [Mycena leptocephala]